MTYFVEGLQGSGKSTLVSRLSKQYPDLLPVREGDYSPVELAWCAYVTQEQYREILDRYDGIRQEIMQKSHAEGDRVVICYTQILTDIPGFHRDLEQYEIYNNREEYGAWKAIILNRFRRWEGDGMIFECSLFQNIVTDMTLFRNASDREVMEFYREIQKALSGREFRILYLKTSDIPASIGVIRKERSDEQGNELWFPMMMDFFNASPFAIAHGVKGEEGLYAHLSHRQELELRICREIFPEKTTILPSKAYGKELIGFQEKEKTVRKEEEKKMLEDRILRKRISFYGSVQGVGFRYRAKKAAEMVGATGWARNERNHRLVTMEIQGTQEQIRKVIEAVEQGAYVRIERMEEETIPVVPGEKGFFPLRDSRR